MRGCRPRELGSTPNPGLMKIQNTISGKKEDFQTIHNNRVNLFVCGPTVYDNSHIGHARTYIVFDVVARYLKYRGYSVFYLQNITDVDDKIIQRAVQLGVSPRLLAREFERKYLEDMRALGVCSVNYYARATEHIPEIIGQIQRLMEKGFAYETETGVYFDESLFEDFGKLSHKSAEDMEMHRIEPDATKRNPGDFSLWKKRQDGEDVTWDSPWGKGRPGWHIEDTAITEAYFGSQYDIHGGAMDLIFPHHEAEIAQMEAVSGKKPLVRFWMHTGFLNVMGEKMSKSLGNFTTIRDMLQKYDADSFRFFILLTHYRSPIDFSEDALEQARKSLHRIRQAAKIIEEILETVPESPASEEIDPAVVEARAKFMESMNSDFNTPYALRAVFNLIREINRQINEKTISKRSLKGARDLLAQSGEILGISFSPKEIEIPEKAGDLSYKLVGLLIDIRQKLRQKKEWTLADEIRSRLNELGFEIEDRKA